MKPIDERENFDFNEAKLVASSRSGVTQNVILNNGKIVEVQFLKSGRVLCMEILVINSALIL